MHTPLSIPAIGEPWPGQGGTYAGVCRGIDGKPDHHLILSDAKSAKRLTWQDGMAWATTVSREGHTDFDLPTIRESSVLFGNVHELLESYWHWTSTQYSAGYAFVQYFVIGYQDYLNDKKFEGRVRAVRRLPVNSSILSAGVDQAAEVAR